MKTRSKALVLSLCAVLLVAASVLGTVAYLTATDTVTNTFTVGSVAITLDETDVDDSTSSKERDNANRYDDLVPGGIYTKDPIVHVDADSQNCWVFIKVENGLAAYEADNNTIATQIEKNGWKPVVDADGKEVENVYYQAYQSGKSDNDLVVFETFTIDTEANNVEGWADIEDGAQIVVTAYAVQMAGFEDDVAGAWDVAKDLG